MKMHKNSKEKERDVTSSTHTAEETKTYFATKISISSTNHIIRIELILKSKRGRNRKEEKEEREREIGDEWTKETCYNLNNVIKTNTTPPPPLCEMFFIYPYLYACV
jgi:hypothetical protein